MEKKRNMNGSLFSCVISGIEDNFGQLQESMCMLGRQLATEAAVCVLAADGADRHQRYKERCQALAWKPSRLASCYGCGAPLQTVVEATPGYVAYCKCMCLLSVSEVCCKCFIWMLQK